jgi:hypothetical protein
MAQADLYSMPLNESRLIRAIQLNHSGIAAALLDQGADIDDCNSARGVGFPGPSPVPNGCNHRSRTTDAEHPSPPKPVFRAYQEHPPLADPAFTPAQVQEIKAGRKPEGRL